MRRIALITIVLFISGCPKTIGEGPSKEECIDINTRLMYGGEMFTYTMKGSKEPVIACPLKKGALQTWRDPELNMDLCRPVEADFVHRDRFYSSIEVQMYWRTQAEFYRRSGLACGFVLLTCIIFQYWRTRKESD